MVPRMSDHTLALLITQGLQQQTKKVSLRVRKRANLKENLKVRRRRARRSKKYIRRLGSHLYWKNAQLQRLTLVA